MYYSMRNSPPAGNDIVRQGISVYSGPNRPERAFLTGDHRPGHCQLKQGWYPPAVGGAVLGAEKSLARL
jgi:hypothetical protein